MDFLKNLEADILKIELIAFLECEDTDIEDMESTEDFIEQFVNFIKEDFSYAE